MKQSWRSRQAPDLSRRRLIQLGAAAGAGLAVIRATELGTRAQGVAGELAVGYPGVNFRTEPDRASIGTYPLNTNIFEGLARLSDDYQVEPMLAESWEFITPNTWRFFPDPTSRVLVLQAGEADLIADLPKESAADIEGGGFQTLRSAVGAYSALYVNFHGAEPYDLGVIPIAGLTKLYGASDRVQGLVPHPSGLNQRWTDVAVTAQP